MRARLSPHRSGRLLNLLAACCVSAALWVLILQALGGVHV